MPITTREAQPADRDFILSLVPRFSQFEMPAWRTRDEIDRTNQVALQAALDGPEAGAAIFVAVDEHGQQAGFIHLQTPADFFNGEKTAYISDLAVAQAFEGQGVGRVLLALAESWAQAQGCRLLTLYVFANNERARAIYVKNGFQPEVMKYVKKLGG